MTDWTCGFRYQKGSITLTVGQSCSWRGDLKLFKPPCFMNDRIFRSRLCQFDWSLNQLISQEPSLKVPKILWELFRRVSEAMIRFASAPLNLPLGTWIEKEHWLSWHDGLLACVGIGWKLFQLDVSIKQYYFKPTFLFRNIHRSNIFKSPSSNWSKLQRLNINYRPRNNHVRVKECGSSVYWL